MEKKIQVKKNTENYESCYCCAKTMHDPKLWNIQFTRSNQTTTLKLCKIHLQELKEEIEKAIG